MLHKQDLAQQCAQYANDVVRQIEIEVGLELRTPPPGDEMGFYTQIYQDAYKKKMDELAKGSGGPSWTQDWGLVTLVGVTAVALLILNALNII
jgi:hypothetical protein